MENYQVLSNQAGKDYRKLYNYLFSLISLIKLRQFVIKLKVFIHNLNFFKSNLKIILTLSLLNVRISNV